jgi:hypothetical protein
MYLCEPDVVVELLSQAHASDLQAVSVETFKCAKYE